jgi:conjugal transfer/entry exclusion protein
MHTPEQLALARRIVTSLKGKKPDWPNSTFWTECENAALAAIIATQEANARVAETLSIGGGTISSWVNANESPMGATRRRIAAAIRAGNQYGGE